MLSYVQSQSRSTTASQVAKDKIILAPVDNGGLGSALHRHRQDIVTRQRLDSSSC